MSLSDKQIAETFELLKLATPEQREDFLANLRFMEFNDRQQSYDVYWTDGVTGGEPPKELLEAVAKLFGSPPDELG